MTERAIGSYDEGDAEAEGGISREVNTWRGAVGVETVAAGRTRGTESASSSLRGAWEGRSPRNDRRSGISGR